MNKYNVTTFTRANLGEALEGFEISFKQARLEIADHHRSMDDFLTIDRIAQYSKTKSFSSRDVLLFLGY